MKALQTPKFKTRQFLDTDWQDVMKIALDWSKAPGPKFDKWPTSDNEVKKFTSHLSGNRKYWAVVFLDSNSVVGLVVVNGVQDGMADVGHVFHSSIQDGKQDLEVIRAFVSIVFESEEIKGIITYNDPTHKEQIAPLLDLGFKADDVEKGKLTKLREPIK